MFLLGINPSNRTTVQEFPLGSLLLVQGSGVSSPAVYEYVQAGAALSVAHVVLINGATGAAVTATVTSSAPGTGQGKRVGVVETAFASGEFGWVKVWGKSSCYALASCAAFTNVNTTATSGALDDDATASSELIEGLVFTAATGGTTAITACMLCFPKVGRTL